LTPGPVDGILRRPPGWRPEGLVRRLARLAMALVVALQLASGSAQAERPLEAKLFVVVPGEFGDGWTAERERDEGDLYQIVYARPSGRGEPPMATVTIGLAQADADVASLLAGSRSLYEANGYTFEPDQEVGDKNGWRGTMDRPGVVGTIYLFAVGQAVVFAAVLGPPERADELHRTATLLARAQEQRLPRG
jgi:hypothetical protein